jgi:hypothetical protein
VFFLIKEKRILRNLQRVAGDIRPLVVKDLPALPETFGFQDISPFPANDRIHPVSSFPAAVFMYRPLLRAAA